MKKGYKRLLVLSFILIVLSFLNALSLNIFSGYKIAVFLLLLLIVFNKIFVIERDRQAYLKDAFFEVFVFVTTFFIFYYLLGLIIGLAKTPNYLTLINIKNILIPIILYSILREIIRFNMLSKAEGSKLCTVVVVLVFILLDVSNTFYSTLFNSQYDVLRFVALTFLPAISKNISYSYITKKTGYKPVILYDLVFSLFLYVLPIVPNVNEYVISIIYLVLPILFAYRIHRYFNRRNLDKRTSSYYKVKYRNVLVPSLIVLFLVYLFSGYFRYYAIVIASGSMEPIIHKGDLVIVDKKYSYDDIDIGEVIAYEKDNTIIVHRIIKKVNYGGSYIYYTKGDANNKMDDLMIKEDMIIGIIDYNVPYVGYPTIWFNGK